MITIYILMLNLSTVLCRLSPYITILDLQVQLLQFLQNFLFILVVGDNQLDFLLDAHLRLGIHIQFQLLVLADT